MLTESKNEHDKHLVALDLGSNSFHIVIVHEKANGMQVIHKQKQSTKLAAGLDKNNNLSKEAINIGINCLKGFSHSFSTLNNCHVGIVATYALRQANNSDEFIQQAAKVLPYPIEIISGKREAELIFSGVAHNLVIEQPTLIIDIGGGSTEFVIGESLTPQLTNSTDMGCVSFTQAFFPSGEISSQAMNSAKEQAKQTLKAISKPYNDMGWQHTLGTSGSMKAIALAMNEIFGDREVTTQRLNILQALLIEWGHKDKILLQKLSDKRRPLIAAAVAILSVCFEVLNIESLNYNSSGVREGLLYQLKNKSNA